MFQALIAFIVKLAKLFTGKKLIVWLGTLVWGLFLKFIRLITRRRAFSGLALGLGRI